MASKDESTAPAATRQRKLLVAIDESQESLKTLEWALENIVQPGDKIHLLHANPPISLYGGPMVGPAAVYMPVDYAQAAEKYQAQHSKEVVLKAKAMCVAARQDVLVEGDVILGEPREAICSAVDQLEADLLIMGSHGYGALSRAFLGSTSDYCVHHAKCPVLVVKSKP